MSKTLRNLIMGIAIAILIGTVGGATTYYITAALAQHGEELTKMTSPVEMINFLINFRVALSIMAPRWGTFAVFGTVFVVDLFVMMAIIDAADRAMENNY